jgi:ribosomal protein L18
MAPEVLLGAFAKSSQCNQPFSSENVISILPTAAADKERLIKRIERLREQGLTHPLKKASGSNKKRKKTAQLADDAEAPVLVAVKATESSGKPTSNGIGNTATAALVSKVLAEEQEKSKRRKVTENDNLKTLFSSTNNGGQKDGDFMTRGFSIPTPTGTRR